MFRIVVAILLLFVVSCGAPAAVVPTSSPSATPSSAESASPTATPTETPAGSVVASPTPATLLTAAEVDALGTALAVERFSHAQYAQVLADLGDVRPFSNITDAEAQHVDQIKTLMTRYAVAIPADATTGVVHYASLPLACVAAASNEQQVVTTYDELLTATTRADLLTLFGNLREVSLDNHLVAFTRC
jgi:hypothetical protein